MYARYGRSIYILLCFALLVIIVFFFSFFRCTPSAFFFSSSARCFTLSLSSFLLPSLVFVIHTLQYRMNIRMYAQTKIQKERRNIFEVLEVLQTMNATNARTNEIEQKNKSKGKRIRKQHKKFNLHYSVYYRCCCCCCCFGW